MHLLYASHGPLHPIETSYTAWQYMYDACSSALQAKDDEAEAAKQLKKVQRQLLVQQKRAEDAAEQDDGSKRKHPLVALQHPWSMPVAVLAVEERHWRTIVAVLISPLPMWCLASVHRMSLLGR